MFLENHHVAVATAIVSSWPHLVSSSDDSCCNHIFLFPGIYVATTISCQDLAFSSFAELCVETKFLCPNTVSIVSQFNPWSQPPFQVATSFLVFYLHASCDSNC